MHGSNALLKKNVPEFETEMRAHLKEEEETIPQALRDNFTEVENDKTVEKILQGGGFALEVLAGCDSLYAGLGYSRVLRGLHWLNSTSNQAFGHQILHS